MDPDRFIPRGAASFAVAYDGPPRDFAFVLLPRLTLLAFSAAVEPLRVANQVTRKELYRWYTASADGGPVRCSNGVTILPDFALGEVPESAAAFLCAGVEPARSAARPVLDWLRRQRAHGRSVGSICTGAFALAEAGMLDGRRFTLHWENQPGFAELYPALEPTPKLYEIDGSLMTCGGGSAATDMMLAMIEAEHGRDLAVIVADMCIHARSEDQNTPQKSALSVAIGSRNPHLIAAIQRMQERLEEPLGMTELADGLGISRRQLERLFRKYVGTTPNRFYFEMRIARAHALLSETNMPVTEVAMATGFGSPAQFAARFRKRYGLSPRAFRKSWAGAPS